MMHILLCSKFDFFSSYILFNKYISVNISQMILKFETHVHDRKGRVSLIFDLGLSFNHLIYIF